MVYDGGRQTALRVGVGPVEGPVVPVEAEVETPYPRVETHRPVRQVEPVTREDYPGLVGGTEHQSKAKERGGEERLVVKVRPPYRQGRPAEESDPANVQPARGVVRALREAREAPEDAARRPFRD